MMVHSTATDRTFLPSFKCERVVETQQAEHPHYYYPGASVEGGGRDGVLIRVTPENGRAWLGTFAFGQLTTNGITGVFTTPNPDQVCVIAAGEGYIVSANKPTEWDQVRATPVIDVRPIHSHLIIVFANFTELVAYGPAGLKWRTRRLSWDSLKIHEVTDTSINGEFLDILSNAMEHFVVDLETGADTGGIGDI